MINSASCTSSPQRLPCFRVYYSREIKFRLVSPNAEADIKTCKGTFLGPKTACCWIMGWAPQGRLGSLGSLGRTLITGRPQRSIPGFAPGAFLLPTSIAEPTHSTAPSQNSPNRPLRWQPRMAQFWNSLRSTHLYTCNGFWRLSTSRNLGFWGKPPLLEA